MIELIEENKLDRVKYGFSPNIRSFKGELVTVKEGLRHYNYFVPSGSSTSKEVESQKEQTNSSTSLEVED